MGALPESKSVAGIKSLRAGIVFSLQPVFGPQMPLPKQSEHSVWVVK
jgi:hypothetical protein